jgi:hypothetical protein
MKPSLARGLASICFLAVCSSSAIEPQQPSGSAQAPTIRVQSSLVLVDVISQDSKSGLPIRNFKKEDFRLFDNRREVPISTFDAGARYDTRPVTLWLVVICNEGGQGPFWASAEFKGKESLFRPALDHLESHDTVGIAHWCDNGETQLDLLPTEDRDSPIRVLAETIKPISFHGGTSQSDAAGEEAFRKMVRLIIRDAHRKNPQPLPVIVFLHGDHTGQPRDELDELVNDFLETSGIVFGIKDVRSPGLHLLGEQSKIMQYMAKHTGGEYIAAPPSGYAAALETILMQLHFRYELGFIPPTIDGKRHELKVELTKEAKAGEHKGVRLRFRTEYIPVREAPEWAH